MSWQQISVLIADNIFYILYYTCFFLFIDPLPSNNIYMNISQMFLWRFAVTLNLHDKLMILASLGWVQTQSAGIRHYLSQIFPNWSCLYWSQSADDSLYLTKEF